MTGSAKSIGFPVSCQEPLILIDFGIATTCDVLVMIGGCLGGIVAAGIRMSVEALNGATVRLLRPGMCLPRSAFGRNAVAVRRSSIYWGYVSLVKGSVARIRAKYGALPNVIGTGEHRLSVAAGSVMLEKADLDPIFTQSRLLAKCDPDPILSRTYSPDTLKLDLGRTMIPALRGPLNA